MKTKTLAALVALACIGGTASAATNVHAWTDTDYGVYSDNLVLGPALSYHIVTLTNPGGDSGASATFDDAWTFTLSDPTNLDSYAATWQVKDTNISSATFSLFSGTPGSGTQVFSSAVDNAGESFSSTNLTPGAYYFEISGTYSTKYGYYEIDATANNAGGPSAVPEPANAALLFAGLGMVGLVAKRRRASR
jgi:hypothetical protein